MKLTRQICLVLLLTSMVFSFNNCNNDDDPLPSREGFYAVSGLEPGIYDQQNRFALLRGVNYSVLGDYYQAIDSIPSETDYDPIHIEEMAKLGFNVIRLVLSWSELEPERGNYNTAYINQIKEIVDKAAQHDIGIVLDMHQDAWGKYIATPEDATCPLLLSPSIGWDGAPEWATIRDGATTCGLGLRELSPAVWRCFQNFYNNRDGIRDAYVDMWRFLVRNFAADINIVGYDIINEPNLGEQIGYGHEVLLGGLYSAVIEGIRAEEAATAGGFNHIVFFEPTAEWSAFTWTFGVDKDFTDDKNIVFAPHIYGGSITVLGNEQDGFRNAEILARYYQTTFWSGEWGYFGNPATQRTDVLKYAKLEDDYLVGGAWWQWIQACGDPHNITSDLQNLGSTNSQHLWNLNCPGDIFIGLLEPYTSILSRAYPRATPGKLLKLESDVDGQKMSMEGEGKGEVDIWVPNRGNQPVVKGDVSNVNIISKNGGFRVLGDVDGFFAIEITY
ncbi:MAG: cellulase family glycosylhydrolase [Chitinophagales bacterium]